MSISHRRNKIKVGTIKRQELSQPPPTLQLKQNLTRRLNYGDQGFLYCKGNVNSVERQKKLTFSLNRLILQ